MHALRDTALRHRQPPLKFAVVAEVNDQHHSYPVHGRASIPGKRGTILFEITEPNVQVTGQDVDVRPLT